MLGLRDMRALAESLPEQDQVMPVLFVGHGSPMNGIEDNEFSARWRKMGAELSQPRAVLCVSAHWLTTGTFVTAMEQPRTIHDFGGFPRALYEVDYPAPGAPALAQEAAGLVQSTQVGLDHDWGLDHGTWSVVKQMYPHADIPVLQLSIDYDRPAEFHYYMGRELGALRKKGVLIIGSGNMVHNLRMAAFERINEQFGFDWAIEMNETFKRLILSGDHRALMEWEQLGQAARLAIPTPDHYYPLMYVLGLQRKQEEPLFFNDTAVAGSLTMTSVKIG